MFIDNAHVVSIPLISCAIGTSLCDEVFVYIYNQTIIFTERAMFINGVQVMRIANSKKLLYKTSKRKKIFFDNLHHTLHQDSRVTIRSNFKKADLNLFSKNFAACFSESTITSFSSLWRKCLVFNFYNIFLWKLWKLVLETNNKIMKDYHLKFSGTNNVCLLEKSLLL